MNLLGLPGNNSQTGPWMEQLLADIGVNNAKVHTQYYSFWSTSDPEIDMDAELRAAQAFEPDMIVAKSMGAMLALNGLKAAAFSLEKCVFIGIPIENVLAKELLEDFEPNCPTLFIQQTNDVTGSFRQLQQHIPYSSCCEVVEVSGSDHVYSNTSELAKIIQQWQRGS